MDSKITLGLGGVTIVIASVISSIGFFGFMKIPATLIIMEVVTFNYNKSNIDISFIVIEYLDSGKLEKKCNLVLDIYFQNIKIQRQLLIYP